MKNPIIFIIPLLALAGCSGGDAPLYKDPAQPAEKRAEDLTSRMTLEQKVPQMCQWVGLEHMKSAEKELTEEELHRLVDMDVAGEVCLHFINHQGKICDPVIDSRTVSIPFEELLQKETRVAVVSGRLKTEAVCSALEGGIVNVLICDEDIARGIVVRIHEKERI